VGTWTFDPLHTQVEFSAKHLGMMTVRGHFAEVTATGELYPDQPERSKVFVTINTPSIRTHNEQRDNDLRGSYFLEIEKYPTITFKSTRIETKGKDKDAGPLDGTMTGDLTIKGVTKPVTLNVAKYGEFNDPGMGHRIAYAAQTKINRQDYNMKFDAMLDGKFVVSHEIQINIEGELLEVEPKETAASGASQAKAQTG
jgi:polyisoprenoid-binding protein YceI